jgi:uncharacterized protein YdaU (DUF1376 family)
VSQAPVMPLYTDAMLGDTMHLSTEEFGAYCLILFTMWRNGGEVLDDDRSLARICRVSPRRWRERLRPRLIGFFEKTNQRITQKRLVKEYRYVQQRAEVARANGLKGGRSRNPAGSLQLTQPHPQPLDSHTPSQYFNNKYLNLLPAGANAHAREGLPPEAPWAQRCRSWANGHRWNPMDGPAPDEPGCLAPPDLAAEAVRQRKCH